MKSEERHQLHENALAGAVDRSLKKIEPYSNQILIGILVFAVLAIGFSMWRSSSGGAAAEAWQKFAGADAADSFLTVADEYPNTEVANWARLRAAEQFLNQGIRTATSDRKATEDNLKRAEETLNSLLNSKGTVLPQVRERALYAMAVCRETLSTGDTTSAIKAYQALLEEFPQAPTATLVQQRIKDLELESTQEFYAWFDKQPRKPEDRPKPKELVGPATGTADPFLFGNDLTPSRPQNPDRPPSPEVPQRPGEGAAPFPAGEAATSPAAEAAPQGAEAKPADATKPAETTEKPTDPAKPADEKPAASN